MLDGDDGYSVRSRSGYFVWYGTIDMILLFNLKFVSHTFLLFCMCVC